MKLAAWVLALAAFCGLGLGEAAWGLADCQPAFAWPDFTHAQFLFSGALFGLGWALAQAASWRLTWGLPWRSGLRGGSAALLPGTLGFAWRFFQRPILPSPHDLTLRSLQVFLAGLLLACLFFSFLFMLLRLRWTPQLRRLTGASLALRLGCCAWIFFLLSGFWGWSWRNTGDQPHYLLMAQSLSQDHDLDLANNYASGEWKAYYDRSELLPQYPAQAGHVYTEHKPLLPLLAAPLFGVIGPVSGLLVSSCISALGVGLVAWLLLSAGFGASMALLGTALLSFNAAWWTHSAAFYPDALAGLLLLAASASIAGPLPWAVAPLCVAAMAWVNVRCYPAALVLALMMMSAHRRGLFRTVLASGLIGLSFALALANNAAHFGSSDPTAAYQSIHKNLGDLFALGSLWQQAWGQWLDQEYGLLTWAPVFVFGFSGLLAWKHSQKLPLLTYLLPALAYYAPVAAYFDWTGVMAPCRYLIPLLPLLSLGACFAFAGLGKRVWVFWAFFALTCAEGLLVAVLPWLNFSKMDGKNMILRSLEAKLGLNLTGFFPSFMMGHVRNLGWILGLIAFIFVNVSWLRRAGSRDLLDPRSVNPARPGREQR